MIFLGKDQIQDNELSRCSTHPIRCANTPSELTQSHSVADSPEVHIKICIFIEIISRTLARHYLPAFL